MQPSSDLHTPCAHQHAKSIATPVTLDHLICWNCSAKPWEVAACLAWFAKCLFSGPAFTQNAFPIESYWGAWALATGFRRGWLIRTFEFESEKYNFDEETHVKLNQLAFECAELSASRHLSWLVSTSIHFCYSLSKNKPPDQPKPCVRKCPERSFCDARCHGGHGMIWIRLKQQGRLMSAGICSLASSCPPTLKYHEITMTKQFPIPLGLCLFYIAKKNGHWNLFWLQSSSRPWRHIHIDQYFPVLDTGSAFQL